MFYVTIKDGSRTSLALGPFETHEEALEAESRVREYVLKEYDLKGAWFWAYGTSRLKEGPYPQGKLNSILQNSN